MKLIEKLENHTLWESVYGKVLVTENKRPHRLVATCNTYESAVAWLRRKGYVK
jgi:hypothetical protein